MTDKLHRRDADLVSEAPPSTDLVPGKRSLTASIARRPQIVFRVESAEAAAVFADRFGPRDDNGVAAGADDAVDRAAGTSGSPLPADLRVQFEASLGTDLSGVRIHTGSESQEASSAVGAKAYTTGQDIHFGDGHYDPSSAFGVHLIAHEVAHTVQQRGASPTMQHKLEVSAPQDSAELEADRAADAMVAGRPAGVSTASAGVHRKPIRDPQGNEVELNDFGDKDPGQKQFADEYRGWEKGDQNALMETLKPIDYVAAAGASDLPAAPLPTAAIMVESMPKSQSEEMERSPFIDQRLQADHGNVPLLVQRQPSAELAGSWNAYASVCTQTDQQWSACRGPLDQYLVADKETSHELQEAFGMEIRSKPAKSINQQVDAADAGAAGFKLNAEEIQHLKDTGDNPAVKKQLDAVAKERSKLDGCLGGMKEGMAAVKGATAGQELTGALAELDALTATQDSDKQAVESAKGLSAELKGNISTVVEIATAAGEAWAGKPDKLVGMGTDFIYEKALSTLHAEEVAAATAKLAATSKKIDALKGRLPGIKATISTAKVEEAVGKMQKARGELKAQLITCRQAHDELAKVVAVNYARQSGSNVKPNPFDDPQQSGAKPAVAEDQKMAAAIRAIPKVTKVLALAQACQDPLLAATPSSAPAQKGYALAEANGYHSAAQLKKVIAWIAGGRQRINADIKEWKSRQAQLETMMNALEHKEM